MFPHSLAPPTRLPQESLDELYDIKFCADDKMLMRNKATIPVVHRRWYQLPCVTCCDQTCFPKRQGYKAGKIRAYTQEFAVTPSQKRALEAVMERDTAFLIQCGLMDYSLLVGVRYRPLTPEEDTMQGPQRANPEATPDAEPPMPSW